MDARPDDPAVTWPPAREATCIFRGSHSQAEFLKSLLADRGVETRVAADPFMTGANTFEVYAHLAGPNEIRVQAALEQFDEKLIRAGRSLAASDRWRLKRRFWGASFFVLTPLSFPLALVPLAPAAVMAAYAVLAVKFLRSASRQDPPPASLPLAAATFCLAELVLGAWLFVSFAGLSALLRR